MKPPRIYAWFLLVLPLGLIIGLFFAMVSGGANLDPYSKYRTSPSKLTSRKKPSPETPATAPASAMASSPTASQLARSLIRSGARPNQATLMFKDAAAYQAFLKRAESLGLRTLQRIDALRTVLVGFDSLDGLAADLAANPDAYTNAEANFPVGFPQTPAGDLIPADQQPVGSNLLEMLGLTGDIRQLGKGITIAVLDGGMATDATLAGRLRTLDIGMGVAGDGEAAGHGIAVAALAAGASADAQGVAPAASILSIKVTAPDGLSDQFTLAQAIVTAADAGARIINISMGAYQTGSVLTAAIDYASERGIAVVAAAGNDGAGQLTWPAADPRVISVGAVDGAEQQVYFSNTGDSLKLTAPGYAVQTAWTEGARVNFSGTSASAPIVSGAIAALLSQNTGVTPAQAAETLQTYSSDAGSIGADPAYGAGVLNLGWALNRSNPSYKDPALAGQSYDRGTDTIQIAVQNRSGSGTGGLQVAIDDGTRTAKQYVPWLGPGETRIITVPGSSLTKDDSGKAVFKTELLLPSSTSDVAPWNNKRSSSLKLPRPE